MSATTEWRCMFFWQQPFSCCSNLWAKKDSSTKWKRIQIWCTWICGIEFLHGRGAQISAYRRKSNWSSQKNSGYAWPCQPQASQNDYNSDKVMKAFPSEDYPVSIRGFQLGMDLPLTPQIVLGCQTRHVHISSINSWQALHAFCLLWTASLILWVS